MLLKKNNQLKLFLTTSLFLGVTLYAEFSFLPVESYLYPRSILAVIIIILLKKGTFNKSVKKYTLLFLISIFFLNLLLNIINVYNLDSYETISKFCNTYSQACSLINTLFFRLKIYRFITISSFFFSIPILIILFAECKSLFKIKKNDIFNSIFYILFFTILFSNVSIAIQKAYLSIIQSSQVLNENYYDRFIYKNGGISYYGWIRVYSNFIIEYTDSKSNILVPPRSTTYKMEGNINYLRWFLYPRNLYHKTDLSQDIKIDYLVLSAGECDNNDCVWPNYEIPKDEIEEIVLIDRETQQLTSFSSIEYIPDHFVNQWGIIKLK